MHISRPPAVVRPFYKDLVWRIPTSRNEVFLTFDDGPHPEITPWVLDVLRNYRARATFFCVGANVHNNPDIFQTVLSGQHTAGNHTYDHLNGWETDNRRYFRNVEKAREVIKSRLFRPPYGKITRSQASQLKRKYRIVMWDVLSGDFDKSLSAERCLKNILDNYSSGSVIVMHDSEKAEKNMKGVLPELLKILSEQEVVFSSIPEPSGAPFRMADK